MKIKLFLMAWLLPLFLLGGCGDYTAGGFKQ